MTVRSQRKNWILATSEPALAESMARELVLARPLAQVLINRGYRDVESASRYLNPQLRLLTDPFDLPDMSRAVEAVLAAVASGQRIVVYGDYDVDGITSTTFLVKALQAAGGKVSSFLPHRMDEGYGLSREGISRCFAELQPELLIAVDCGTTSVAEVAAMKTKGVNTIILDHHEPPSALPDCLALVNPKRAPSRDVPWTHLASVGVTFKFVHALLKRGRDSRLSWAETFDLRDHLDLVATGTVADIVSLTGENRLLTKAGLDRLSQTSNVGLRALMEVAGVTGKITPYHISYRLAPRLNAAGRLADARDALELLLTDNAARAGELAQRLHDHNSDRQQIEERICAEAVAMVRDDDAFKQQRVIVLANPEWHIGVVGIVASRLMQEYYRPAIVIGMEKGLGKGSCRSISGFSMVDALQECSRYLIKHGGHDMAAGLSIHLESVDEFRRAINQVADMRISDDQLRPRLKIDAEVGLDELDYDFFRQQERFEPCGLDNPKPVFMTRSLRIIDTPRVVGRKHLKFTVADDRARQEAIWWNMADAGLPAGRFDMAFYAELNEFRGTESVQLNVRDIDAGN